MFRCKNGRVTVQKATGKGDGRRERECICVSRKFSPSTQKTNVSHYVVMLFLRVVKPPWKKQRDDINAKLVLK